MKCFKLKGVVLGSAVAVAMFGCCERYVPKLEPLQKLTVKEEVYNTLSFRCFWKMLRDDGITPHFVNLDIKKGIDGFKFLSFDGSDKVFVFRGENHEQNIKLELPKTFRMQGIWLRDNPGFVILSNQSEASGSVAIIVLLDQNGKPSIFSENIEGLVRENDGILDPILIGYDIERGIYFSGRDKKGKPWGRIYRLLLKEGKITFKEIDDKLFYNCDRYSEWFRFGVDARKTTGSFYNLIIDILDKAGSDCKSIPNSSCEKKELCKNPVENIEN